MTFVLALTPSGQWVVLPHDSTYDDALQALSDGTLIAQRLVEVAPTRADEVAVTVQRSVRVDPIELDVAAELPIEALPPIR